MRKNNTFIEYVYSFYGTGGIYADDFEGGCTLQEITDACNQYINDTATVWGGGDSVDREKVRDILLKNSKQKYGIELTEKQCQLLEHLINNALKLSAYAEDAEDLRSALFIIENA